MIRFELQRRYKGGQSIGEFKHKSKSGGGRRMDASSLVLHLSLTGVVGDALVLAAEDLGLPPVGDRLDLILMLLF
jgi:hypothetical protein